MGVKFRGMGAHDDAVTFLEEFRRMTASSQMMHLARCARDRAYCYGDQWVSTNTDVLVGLDVTQLRTYWNPDSPNLRVTDNRIRENAEKHTSILTPPSILTKCKPAGYELEDEYCSRTMNPLMETVTGHPVHGAIEAWRQANRKRVVDGDGIVEAQIFSTGSDVRKAGDSQIAFDKRRLRFRSIDAWELVLDPFQSSPNLDEHEIVLHSTVLTEDEARRQYGARIESLDPKGNAGDLLRVHNFLSAATNFSFNSGFRTGSRTKAFVVHKLFVKGPDGYWTDLYVFVEGEDKEKYVATRKPIRCVYGLEDNEQNPFNGLPYMKLGFWEKVGTPWCDGVPSLCIRQQNIHNLFLTKMLRVLYYGAPKWVVNKGSLDDDLQEAILSNVDLRIIPYTQMNDSDRGPRLESAPEPGQALMQQVNSWPNTMRTATGLGDIVFGEVSKRGESGEAIEQRTRLASSVSNMITMDDEKKTAAFLGMVGWSLPRHWPTFLLNEATQGEVGPEAIQTFVKSSLQNPYNSRALVIVEPGTMQSRTPEEVREELAERVALGLMRPDQYAYAYWRRTGMAPDPVTGEAFDSARTESLRILRGMDTSFDTINVHQQHEHHITAHKYALERAIETKRYDDEFVDELTEHIEAHQGLLLALGLQQQSLVQAAGNPAAGAPQMGGTMSGLPAGASGPSGTGAMVAGAA